MYRQRSSPTTATAIASATVTIQNLPNSIPACASRVSSSAHFPNQYQMNAQHDYRMDNRQKHYQMAQMYSGDMYNAEHPIVNDTQNYHRTQNHSTNVGQAHSRVAARNRPTSYGQNYGHQYYYQKNQSGDSYNVGHNYVQGYHNDPSYNHYNYAGNHMYPSDGNEAAAAHMPNSVHLNQDQTNYYSNESIQGIPKVQNHEYNNKIGYFENTAYNSNHLSSNGEASYSMSGEMFHNCSTAMMTPPASISTENTENYNYHPFYNETQTQVAPPTESSNSSSDFNFLSNLANDYTPEYYQI